MKKPFYGWVIVLCGALSLALGIGMFTSTNSVFVKPICDSLGFSRGRFTLYRTIIKLMSALSMPLYGRMIPRLGVKRVTLIGAVMLAAVSLGYSFATKLWHFYLLSFVNGFFYNAISFMSVGVLVSAWFVSKRGLAIGIAYAGSGLGGAIMIPVVSGIISQAGWQWAYRFMSGIGLAVLLPASLLFIKNHPADMGLEPLQNPGEAGESGAPKQGNTLQEILRTPKLWLLIVAFFFIDSFSGAANTHSAPFLSDLGHSAALVSSIVSLFMIFLSVGKILLGVVYDRYGTLAGNSMVAFFSIGFPIFALLSGNLAFAWVYAIFVGMASCGVSVLMSVSLSRYYGDKDFPAIFGFCAMVASFAPAISVPAMGAVYDVTGSYRWAWIVFFLTGLIIAACLTSAEMLNRKELRKQ